MRIIKKLFLFVVMVLCFSCEEQVIFINCQDCISEEPLDTNLEITLDAKSDGYDTVIKIYEGNLEDSVLYSTRQNNPFSYVEVPVAINKKYTVTATYYIHNNYYTAVDSATPRVKYDKNQCKEPCYFVYDKVIDLKLKYTK